MPIFDFICSSCGFKEETFVQNRGILKECPSCKTSGSFAADVIDFSKSNVKMKFDESYHRSSSTDTRAWDHIVGKSAEKGHQQYAEAFSKKNSILEKGNVPIYDETKNTYVEAPVTSKDSLVSNASVKSSKKMSNSSYVKSIPNDLVK